MMKSKKLNRTDNTLVSVSELNKRVKITEALNFPLTHKLVCAPV